MYARSSFVKLSEIIVLIGALFSLKIWIYPNYLILLYRI